MFTVAYFQCKKKGVARDFGNAKTENNKNSDGEQL
jgi:hypothetical protein